MCVARVFPQDHHDSGIHPRHFSGRAERDHSGRNIFQNCFHQFPAALALLDGLFEISRELIDLAPTFSQLLGHAIERTHQGSQFVLRLHLDAMIEIAARNFACRFSQTLNRHGHLLRKPQRDPGGAGEQDQRDRDEREQNLALESA